MGVIGRVIRLGKGWLLIIMFAGRATSPPTILDRAPVTAPPPLLENQRPNSAPRRGLTELKHFVTKQPIPVEMAAFVVDRRLREPSVNVSIVHDRADRHADATSPKDICSADR